MISRAVLLLALLPACAYSTAMKRGDAALAASEWSRAHAAYTFAQETKETDDSAAGRASALDGQLDAVEAALKAGEFEGAFGGLDTAEDLDPGAPRVAEVRSAAQQALQEALPERTDGELHESYAFAALAKKLHPRSWVVEDTLAAIRQRVVDDAKARQDAGEWPEARASAAVILEHEPELGTLARSLDDAIVKAWTAELLARAGKAEAKQPGLAAVLYAVAHEVGGEPEHLAAARKAYKAAGEAGALSVKVSAEGGTRAKALREAIDAAVEAMEGARAGSDLTISLYTGNPSCKETSEKESKSKEYVSGQKQVPNPEREGAEKAAADADKAASEAASRLERLQVAFTKAEDKVTALDDQHAKAKVAHDSAASTLDVTQKQHDQSKATMEEEAKRAEEFEAKGEKVSAESAREKEAAAKKIYDEWASKLATDAAAEKKAKDALDAVEKERTPEKEAFDALKEQLAKADEKASKTAADMKAAAAKLEKTPKTLDEDILATHTWDEVAWTLDCSIATNLSASTSRWKPTIDTKAKLEGERKTTDTAVKGHEKSGVKDDPKEYPKDRDALGAELEKEAEEAVVTAVKKLVEDYFDVASALALTEKKDTDGATDALIGMLAAAPGRLGGNAEKAVAYVKDAQHLQDYGLLDPKLASGSAAPKAEEPKADAPKAEEPKETPEGAKAAARPEPEAPKAEEPKAEEPKAEEPKADEGGDVWDSPWK